MRVAHGIIARAIVYYIGLLAKLQPHAGQHSASATELQQLCHLWAVLELLRSHVLPAGASSGLHHDFHDNLYILLRGRKRFRLWSPDQAPQLYTHGRLRRIHCNGRIAYHGQVGPQRRTRAQAGDPVALAVCVMHWSRYWQPWSP